MPRSSFQKLKLLYIRDHFYRATDENHPVTVQGLIDMLAQNGITAERKSIYDDIDLLSSYGMDIISEKRGEYYLASREFELPEIKLLVDTVSSSKFLTEKKALSLIKSLGMLCSTHQAREFERQTLICSRIKNMNESIYLTVDTLSSAIRQNKMVSFKYFHYDENKRAVFSRGGEKYSVSPFAQIYDGDNYYLVAYDEINDIIRHFRTDRIKSVEISERARCGEDKFNRKEYIERGSHIFSMYAGRPVPLRLRFDNSLSGVVIDRFGKDVMMIPNGDGRFDVNMTIGISPQFFGWIFGLKDAEIISPRDVRDEYREYIINEMNKYEEG